MLCKVSKNTESDPGLVSRNAARDVGVTTEAQCGKTVWQVTYDVTRHYSFRGNLVLIWQQVPNKIKIDFLFNFRILPKLCELEYI